MDSQAIFDKVANHLLTQRQQCRDNQGCLYRMGAMRCAVGALIDDESYCPEMEQMAVVALHEKFADSANFPWSASQLDLLSWLQLVHDTFEPKEWRWRLVEVAKKFDLTPNFHAV